MQGGYCCLTCTAPDLSDICIRNTSQVYGREMKFCSSFRLENNIQQACGCNHPGKTPEDRGGAPPPPSTPPRPFLRTQDCISVSYMCKGKHRARPTGSVPTLPAAIRAQHPRVRLCAGVQIFNFCRGTARVLHTASFLRNAISRHNTRKNFGK